MKTPQVSIRSAVRLAAVATVATLVGTAAQAYDDGAGHRWAQLGSSQGLTWNQVSSVCAMDGTSACQGSVGGHDLTGWVWATQQQVINLFNKGLAPEQALTPEAPGIDGIEGFFAAQAFIGPVLSATWSFCSNYQCGAFLSGWTANTEDGLGGVAGVNWSTTPGSLSGSMSAGGLSDPDAPLFAHGVWMWQPTAPVPEPASTALMCAGLAAMAWRMRRRQGGTRA